MLAVIRLLNLINTILILSNFETFHLSNFGMLSNKIVHGGQNTPVFKEMSQDAPLCPIKRIIFYIPENVKKWRMFLTNNDIQPQFETLCSQ